MQTQTQHPERRRAPRATVPMFRRAGDGPILGYSVAMMRIKFPHNAGLILWVETADVGETFGAWERVA